MRHGRCRGHTEIEDRREDNTPESRTNAQFSYQVLASQLFSGAAPRIAMVEILDGDRMSDRPAEVGMRATTNPHRHWDSDQDI